MAQKETLRQDCLLIGPPGSQHRRLALWWASVSQRELEYVALSSDTTESDLKQRREVIDGSVHYFDAPPVRAALEGRLLLLDGVEKAERNVLPTLNNLLENREMGLSDGRFLVPPARIHTCAFSHALMNTRHNASARLLGKPLSRHSHQVAPERFDALLAEGYTPEELQQKKLVRVHEDFRVVATGLPVPAFAGFPLDPPLRSRFQGLFVGQPSMTTFSTPQPDM
jgi:MoxR-like ATPase